MVQLLSLEWKALDKDVKADYEKRAAENKRQLEEREEKAKAETYKRASSSSSVEVMDDREESRRKLQRLDSGVAAWIVNCARALPEDEVPRSEEGYSLTPGILPKHAVKLTACKRERFALSMAIVRKGAVYCSAECGVFAEQHLLQMPKWETTEKAMSMNHGSRLFPGDWSEAGTDRCDRCNHRGIPIYSQSVDYDYEERAGQFPPDLCSFCAQLAARHIAVNRTWRYISSDPKHTKLPLRWGIPLTMPDNFVALKRNSVTTKKTCHIEGPRCYGLEWFGPFCQPYQVVVERTEDGKANQTLVCCVFCADDHDAEIRQHIWDSRVAETALVEDCGLVRDVLSVIASYVVGRFLVEDNIDVFDWTNVAKSSPTSGP